MRVHNPAPSRERNGALCRGNSVSNPTSVPLFAIAAHQVGQAGRLPRLRGIKCGMQDAFRNCSASSQTSVLHFRIAERYVGGSGPLLRNAARQMRKAGRLSRLRRIKWEKRRVCPDCGDVCSRSRCFDDVCSSRGLVRHIFQKNLESISGINPQRCLSSKNLHHNVGVSLSLDVI